MSDTEFKPDPEAVNAVARTMWEAKVKNEQDRAKRQELWNEERANYRQTARILVRRLHRKGFEVVSVAGEASDAPTTG